MQHTWSEFWVYLIFIQFKLSAEVCNDECNSVSFHMKFIFILLFLMAIVALAKLIGRNSPLNTSSVRFFIFIKVEADSIESNRLNGMCNHTHLRRIFSFAREKSPFNSNLILYFCVCVFKHYLFFMFVVRISVFRNYKQGKKTLHFFQQKWKFPNRNV